MIEQSKYDNLLKEYRDLQLRVTRFSFIEQQLINTKDQLDHELILYKRLNQFNNEALKFHSDEEFIQLAAETIVDVLEIEASAIYIVGEDFEQFYGEGIKSAPNEIQILKQECLSMASKIGLSKSCILNKRLLDQFDSLNKYTDVIFHALEDQELQYQVYILGFISIDKSPFYEKLQSKHETIFSLFTQQFQSLLSNRIKSKKISESEIELKKLSLIATKTKNGVIIANQFGEIEWVNESFSKTTGYTLEEVIGKKPKDFLQRSEPGDPAQLQLSTALQNKETIEVQIVNYTKDGQPYTNLLEIIPVFDEKGNHINFISLQKDISSEIESKEKILEINSRYDLITEKSKIGIWEWIKHSDHHHWNDILLAQYGTTREKIDGKYYDFWKNAIHPDDRERVLEQTDYLIKSTLDSLELEYRIIRANDGAVRYIKNLTIAERDADGVMLKLVGSSVDISELKNTQEDILSKNSELQKVNTELDNFVYRVSHDLRGPLLSIKGLVSLIFTNVELDAELTEYITLIESSVIRMDETIQEILEYSKNARLELKLESFDVALMVQDIFNDIKFSTDVKVRFTTNIIGDSHIYSDKYRINTVLKNVIGNAVKYRKKDTELAFVDFKLSRIDGFLLFEIVDNGEGISEGNIGKIFNMFYRASSSSVGTGLGLYICKEIITRLQGEIDVESVYGKGTTVRIKVPLQLN
ncbi:MAG: PAS domain-containing protein [Flavobacterium sp.]|nr:PAS domain-containing protein [Flavobacterium sp.]